MAVAVAALPLVTAEAVTHRVPADYPTIHEALAVAAAGDTVRVAPGVWSATTSRTLQIDGVPTTYIAAGFIPGVVTLLSEDGADVTSIEVADARTNVRHREAGEAPQARRTAARGRRPVQARPG